MHGDRRQTPKVVCLECLCVIFKRESAQTGSDIRSERRRWGTADYRPDHVTDASLSRQFNKCEQVEVCWLLAIIVSIALAVTLIMAKYISLCQSEDRALSKQKT